MSRSTITILIADDQEVAREGYRRILETETGLDVVAMADNGLDAVHLAQTSCPDVAILDIRMPHLNGIEAAQRIREVCPQVGIVLLSFYDHPSYVRTFLKEGAAGKAFLLKQTIGRIDELVRAIKAVAAGQMMLDPTIIDDLMRDAPMASLADLTAQEMRVLELMAKGYANAAIAEALVVQERTIENYVSNIFTKLHLKNRGQQARVQAVLLFLEATGRLRHSNERP
ncbi:MAG: response regulator transcription factor [Anaerolineae bacterium]|nr:response regulator transcription factor [Anaerolineae bacterium]